MAVLFFLPPRGQVIDMEKKIQTINGEALYSHTETEDENGSWNDNWSTKNGEFVIHDGNQHHVYIVKAQ